jgi:8-oxo-dGTP pyrophosphatase MutT (NUDIX family)
MDRPSFLKHLAAYAPFDTNEAEMRERMHQFVTGNENCFDRMLPEGHITASCWIVNALPPGERQRSQALLTWHKRLNRWLQMGGHVESTDLTLIDAALREAREESGLVNVRALAVAIFDLDVHLIPERKGEPAHFHYDVRFLLEANPMEPLIVSAESRDVAWVPLSGIATLNTDASMRRMVAKTARLGY